MAVVEAQRLIAVSLGKISQSRIQRGGICLHKNLLVASVLYKARTAFILENSRSRSDSESSEEESPIGWESDPSEENLASGTESLAEAETGSNSPASPEPVENDDCFESEDKENSPPLENDDISELDTGNSVENKTPDVQTSCQRCHKRRMADVDSEEYTSHDSAGDSVVSKKPRLELGDSQKDNQYGSYEPEHSNGPEAMQISTLVNSFNSGFTGLLNTDSVEPLSGGPKDVYESSNGQGQGHTTTTDSLISCSTQIKEAFETLARPILALTV